jgi:4-amino-4-deoxy-L-arabinose transferase-like glycosyltransferase
MYDLTRRRFGRAAGFAAGLVLATTPTIVAVSRHNNPDELLVMLSVAAVWFALRGLETGRTRHLVWSGVMIGLGFETKMGVALMLVPAIALAWLWMRWGGDGSGVRANLRVIGQLLWGGLAMAAVGLAWPLLVTLTPAADRPWISGTADNSIWSLIVGYNGLGRISGQTGGPGGAGGGGGALGGGTNSLFGGNTGIFRLLQSGLGDQAGWLLGFAVVAGLALVVLTRLRRRDPRTGFVIVLGGTLLVIGVVFSFASGIFHPYYVSMVAPWAAALIGAGIGEMLPRPFGVARSSLTARIIAQAALIGGAVTELVILGELSGQLAWAKPVVIGGAVILAFSLAPRLRAALVAVACLALLAAPATWAAETLTHATNGTFPTGGPASAEVGGFGGGGAPGGGGFGRRFRGGFTPPSGGVSSLFGGGGGGGGGGGFAGAGGGAGGFGGDSSSLVAAAKYARTHGGGTVAVDSQSTAAQAIVDGATNVAGIGGFSGRESTVTAQWLAMEVREGRLRWLLGGGTGGASLPGDTRKGSTDAITLAESVARKVTVTYDGSKLTLYDLHGKAAAILAAATKA